MVALPNLSGLSLGGGGDGGGDEEERVAPLDTGTVLQYRAGGPEQRNYRTGFSQLLAEYPITVPRYDQMLDVRGNGPRNQIGQIYKGNLLELGLSAAAIHYHYTQQQWPLVGQQGPQATDDDFVRRWILVGGVHQNTPTPVLSNTTDLQVKSYPRSGPAQMMQIVSPQVGYQSPMEGVLRSANETMLISTAKAQQLAPRGIEYGMATYNEMWFINTRQAQINMWPQMRQQLFNLLEGGVGGAGPKRVPEHQHVITYLRQCLTDLVTNAQRMRPLYMYGGNAIQDVLGSKYEDLAIMARNKANPNNPAAHNRAFFFARRSNKDSFKAFGEVDCLKVAHNTPRAEVARAQAVLDAAKAANRANPSPANQQAEDSAQAYFDRADHQMQINDTAAPWFTLELQQMTNDSMCRHTDWEALNTRPPAWLNYQPTVNKMFAYLAPPYDINTNPMFGDANMTVPWPAREAGEVNGPVDAYRGMSLYQAVRAIEAARAAPGFVEPGFIGQ